jgi:putative transposase
VQEVAPLGSDLPVYPARQGLAPGALGSRQFGCRFADVTRVLDLLPGGKPGQGTEAEVNADFAVPCRKGIRDLANEIEIPAPFGVLAEATRPDVGWDRPRQPQPVFLTEEGHGIAVDLERPVALERHPTKRPLCETMGCDLLACDGEADHLHAVIEYPPKLSISALVNALKGTSSRLLRKERPDIAHRYVDGVLWPPSYFAASTGGAPLDVVRRYVEQQRASTSP